MRSFAAILLFLSLVGCGGSVPLSPLDRAERAGLAGQWDEAIGAANEALAANPRDAAAYTARGRGYFGKRDKERALADYNRAIELDATSSEAHYDRAVVLRALGRREEAAADDELARKYDSSRKLFDALAGEPDSPTPADLVNKIRSETPSAKAKPTESTDNRLVTKDTTSRDERLPDGPMDPSRPLGPMDTPPRKPMQTLSDEFIEKEPATPPAKPKLRPTKKPVVADEPMTPALPPRRVLTGTPGAPPRGAANPVGPANAGPGQPQRGSSVRASAPTPSEAAKSAPPKRQMGGRIWPPVPPQGAAAGVQPKPDSTNPNGR